MSLDVSPVAVQGTATSTGSKYPESFKEIPEGIHEPLFQALQAAPKEDPLGLLDEDNMMINDFETLIQAAFSGDSRFTIDERGVFKYDQDGDGHIDRTLIYTTHDNENTVNEAYYRETIYYQKDSKYRNLIMQNNSNDELDSVAINYTNNKNDNINEISTMTGDTRLSGTDRITIELENGELLKEIGDEIEYYNSDGEVVYTLKKD